MIHRTFTRFWDCYVNLPEEVRELADKNYELLKNDPFHPSLHFKCLKRKRTLWSVRVGDSYRALAIEREKDVFAWFWIGHHAEYDRIIKK
jgi:mRNA-degrading endonuclease RelE of RelBE toxin-antitoxin system